MSINLKKQLKYLLNTHIFPELSDIIICKHTLAMFMLLYSCILNTDSTMDGCLKSEEALIILKNHR